MVLEARRVGQYVTGELPVLGQQTPELPWVASLWEKHELEDRCSRWKVSDKALDDSPSPLGARAVAKRLTMFRRLLDHRYSFDIAASSVCTITGSNVLNPNIL